MHCTPKACPLLASDEQEAVVQGALDSSGQPVDKEFYKTFWGLQKVFQQPYSIMEPSAWAAAVGSIKKVLTEFHKQVGPTILPCCRPDMARM